MLTPGSIVLATEPDQRVGNEEGIRDLECDLLLTSKLYPALAGIYPVLAWMQTMPRSGHQE